MPTSTGSLIFPVGSAVYLLVAVATPDGVLIPAHTRGRVAELLGATTYGESYAVDLDAPYPSVIVSELEIDLASGMQEPAANDTATAAEEPVPAIGPNGADLLVQRAAVLRALSDGRWERGRTSPGIASTTGVPRATVRFLLDVMPDYVAARPGRRHSYYTLTDAGRAALETL